MKKTVFQFRREIVLLKYIVSNFKSIGHPIEFSMLPAASHKDQGFFKTLTTSVLTHLLSVK